MPPPPQLTALDYLSGVLPYVGAALVGWQVLPALLPAHTLPVLVLLATLPPWHGLPPGLAPLLCLGRLRCWLPYPWALKNRRTELTLILAAVSPVLIPAALLSAVLMAWPIWRDYGKYRQATGEMSGVLSAKASAQTGEKHDWRKWLNTRWAESFGWRDVTDPHLPILADAVVADPVGFLPSPLPTRSGPRPAMLRGQPHRQVDQVPLATDKSGQKTVDFSTQSALAKDAFGPAGEGTAKTAMPWVRRCTRSGGDVLLGVPSLFEGTGAKALRFAEPALCDCRSVVAGRKGEFAHIHNMDGSWHVLLAPADAQEVVAKGFGEMWPAATEGWAPIGYVLVYAPRDEAELAVLRKVLAACWDFSSSGGKARKEKSK